MKANQNIGAAYRERHKVTRMAKDMNFHFDQ